MKIDLTELVFILDRSGSLGGLESDTIGDINSSLTKQKNATGCALITTVLFDDRYELLHDRISIEGVAPITADDYHVRGSTALLDAIGKSIAKVQNTQAHTAEAQRPIKTMFVITTDGHKNSSREFSKDKVKAMIEHSKHNGWEFLYLGANIDAVKEGANIGIDASHAVNFHADSIGTSLNYQSVAEAVTQFRTCGHVSKTWREGIDKDYNERA